MGFILRYVQTIDKRVRYRRRIPQDVREALKKNWFTKPLGKTRSEVIRNYGPTNEEFERLVEGAKKRLSQETSEPLDIHELTDIELYQEVLQRLRASNFQRPIPPYDPLDPHSGDELYLRDIEADRVIDDYPIDPDNGGPVGMTRVDAAYVRALYSGPPEQPPPSLEDARQSYIKDREYEDSADSKSLLQVTLVVKHVRDTLGYDPLLTTMTRQEAREVVGYMSNDVGLAPTSVTLAQRRCVEAVVLSE